MNCIQCGSENVVVIAWDEEERRYRCWKCGDEFTDDDVDRAERKEQAK